MTNNSLVKGHFERDKNIKALLLTVLFCTIIFLIFYFISWVTPNTQPVISETGIEVNLGNSETGSGDVAPQVPGEPSKEAAPESQPVNNTPTQVNAQQITADPNETNDVPVINNTVAKVNHTTVPDKAVVKVEKKPAITPAAIAPPPKPKAQLGKYAGGNGPGGNGADSYNGVTNQGVAGGVGDQGSPHGNPNSDSYKGNSAMGKSGVSIRSGLGGRKINKLPNFEDDFNEPGKVAIDITVDKNGNVLNAVFNPSGTTTTNTKMKNIAQQKARELKLTPSTTGENETGTIVFSFKLRGE